MFLFFHTQTRTHTHTHTQTLVRLRIEKSHSKRNELLVYWIFDISAVLKICKRELTLITGTDKLVQLVFTTERYAMRSTRS